MTNEAERRKEGREEENEGHLPEYSCRKENPLLSPSLLTELDAISNLSSENTQTNTQEVNLLGRLEWNGIERN